MSNKEKENNDFCLINPDGKLQNVFESKNIFTNESKNFVQENNTADVTEQEYVEEQFVKTQPKTISRGSTTTLNSVSGFFATTAVAVASSVVIAVAVIVASISNLQLFATTGDSFTFYVQGYLSTEDNVYIARLCSEEKTQEEISITEPFIQFYGLMPETKYTLEVVDPNTQEVVFTQEYTTAPQDSFCISFEPWIEEGILTITTFQEDMPEIEGVQSYTISVYDAKGNNIFEKVVNTLDAEYSMQLPNTTTTPTADPITADGGEDGGTDPTTGDGNGETIPSGDDIITEEEGDMYYVAIVYQKDAYTIGSVQTIFNRA